MLYATEQDSVGGHVAQIRMLCASKKRRGQETRLRDYSSVASALLDASAHRRVAPTLVIVQTRSPSITHRTHGNTKLENPPLASLTRRGLMGWHRQIAKV